MRFAFFENLKIGIRFMYHYEEYVKINEKEGQKVSSGKIMLFAENTVVFPLHGIE